MITKQPYFLLQQSLTVQKLLPGHVDTVLASSDMCNTCIVRLMLNCSPHQQCLTMLSTCNVCWSEVAQSLRHHLSRSVTHTSSPVLLLLQVDNWLKHRPFQAPTDGASQAQDPAIVVGAGHDLNVSHNNVALKYSWGFRRNVPTSSIQYVPHVEFWLFECLLKYRMLK